MIYQFNPLISFTDHEVYFIIHMNINLMFYNPVLHSQSSALTVDYL